MIATAAIASVLRKIVPGMAAALAVLLAITIPAVGGPLARSVDRFYPTSNLSCQEDTELRCGSHDVPVPDQFLMAVPSRFADCEPGEGQSSDICNRPDNLALRFMNGELGGTISATFSFKDGSSSRIYCQVLFFSSNDYYTNQLFCN